MSIQVKQYQAPPVDLLQILRYAGAAEAGELLAPIKALLAELEQKLTYRVCYRLVDAIVTENVCDFNYFTVKSPDLAKHLHGCDSAVLFAATIGVEMDRAIAKYSRLSPPKALLLQAIATERIEALCDLFCAQIKKELGGSCTRRFSPGYGSIPLSVQQDFFKLLECEKRIGVCLTDSLLMVPTKSVTAFIGVKGEA